MPESLITHRLRQCVLAITTLALLVTPFELILVEHYNEPTMFIPFVLAGLALLAIVCAFVWPNKRTFRFLRVAMILLVVGSAVGVFFHLRGNLEISREVDSELRGWGLIWDVLAGSAPALAPGLLAQAGLLGLLYTYKHPVLVNEKEVGRVTVAGSR
jgi:MFS superfamily sulfate permease-like transporter